MSEEDRGKLLTLGSNVGVGLKLGVDDAIDNNGYVIVYAGEYDSSFARLSRSFFRELALVAGRSCKSLIERSLQNIEATAPAQR